IGSLGLFRWPFFQTRQTNRFDLAVVWLYRWLNRQLVVIVFMFIVAATTIVAPFCGSVGLLFFAIICNGMGSGVWDSSQSAWLVELWPHAGPVIMQSVQFMYGIGSILAPIVASPFLHGE